MKPDLLFPLLDRALTEELGLVITTNNPRYLMQKINNLRKGMDKYKSLILTIPSTPETIIIAKETVDLEEIDDQS